MHYRDIRKFGFFDLTQGDPADRTPYVNRVGPDPFEITVPQFTRLVLSKNKAVKSLLLDQSLISGLGNIYVDESLFQAKIHPLTKAGAISAARIKNLHRVIRSVLSRAILKKGSTLKDYRRPDGSSGRLSKLSSGLRTDRTGLSFLSISDSKNKGRRTGHPFLPRLSKALNWRTKEPAGPRQKGSLQGLGPATSEKMHIFR